MASSGEEGIEMAKNKRRDGNDYDLVFMDQDMKNTFKSESAPENFEQLQGHDAVEIMRKLDMQFTIVMRTSECRYQDVRRYYASGADAVLPKSVPMKVISLIFAEGAMNRQLQKAESLAGFILLGIGLNSNQLEPPNLLTPNLLNAHQEPPNLLNA
eukprot:CAMPEP_0185264882 /NCGR_PEP_ID=MMETSP1359-20130426/25278_1 /TAXON_ID=552665 /ORGANISM="Bigelowiella longifila, Strain CCMP242" /LENGTH=155 /DNA_ID=CAMNT_0027853773 /DNA_START=54 /DNA_END=522 /DNA_ORIENTATION=-